MTNVLYNNTVRFLSIKHFILCLLWSFIVYIGYIIITSAIHRDSLVNCCMRANLMVTTMMTAAFGTYSYNRFQWPSSRRPLPNRRHRGLSQPGASGAPPPRRCRCTRPAPGHRAPSRRPRRLHCTGGSVLDAAPPARSAPWTSCCCSSCGSAFRAGGTAPPPPPPALGVPLRDAGSSISFPTIFAGVLLRGSYRSQALREAREGRDQPPGLSCCSGAPKRRREQRRRRPAQRIRA